jgi:integrase
VFLFTAEQCDRDHAALAVLLGLNGLRVSEACATNIEDLGFERGHRTLRIVGKGNKPATVPFVPRTARTIDLAVGERHEGPTLRRRDGQRLDRRTAHRWIRSIGKRAGLGAVHPHMLRAAFIMAALDAGVPPRGGSLGIGQPSNRLRVMRRASHSSPETVRLSITGSISGTRSGVVAQVASGGESNKASSTGSGAWNTQSHRSKSARWIG